MSCLAHLSSTGFQGLMTLPCDLWENLWLLAPLFLRSQRHPYPLPKFNIGDLVASDWVNEYGQEYVDFGEIRGICYLPEADLDHAANTWVYFIYWIRSTAPVDFGYPCYEADPMGGEELRLFKQS